MLPSAAAWNACSDARATESRASRRHATSWPAATTIVRQSGLDLQRVLVESHHDIPVIFITGHGDIPMAVRAMKAGAVDFLPKPFDAQTLLDAIERALVKDRQRRRVNDRSV